MPTVKDVESFLFDFAPKELAMDWDNVGLLVGAPENKIKSVLVALDVTEGVVDEAIASGADLIVAHHPLMNCKWSPVQNVRFDRPQGRVIAKLLRHGMSAICMHTNLDCTKGGVNDALARALGLTKISEFSPDGLGRIGYLPEEMKPESFAAFVKDTLEAKGVRYVSNGRPVKKVAVGGGACGEFVPLALEKGCDAFVTADLSYHEFLDAKALGATVIDAGHFPTEDVVCSVLVKKLKGKYPRLKVKKSASHVEVINYI
ncbi:MAG: Nif3-like dinuclear metal center hexameric protein [Oscillospiraceae bacterium]|nr:Nif3-like dinuclear metal center hexameric protein [Oscillospiraceae bacterium]